MPLTPRDDSASKGEKTRAQRAAETTTPEEGNPSTGAGNQFGATGARAKTSGSVHQTPPTDSAHQTPPTGAAQQSSTTGQAQQATSTFDWSVLMQKLSAIQESQDAKLSAMQEIQSSKADQVLRAISDVSSIVTKMRKDLDQMDERVTVLGTDIENVKTGMNDVKADVDSVKSGLTAMQKRMVRLETSGIAASGTVSTVHGPSVKMPSYDGTTSWIAYRQQFQTVAAANGWTDEQCLTALTVALRGQALSVLEALPTTGSGDKELLEALECRYGERHLEHVFRAQLRDRAQRSGEGLQQWALEIEKLVRKAYPSADANTVNSNTVQAFVDGIKDLEVRAAVKLRHHISLKEALAHALEVEVVRQDNRPSHKLREVTEEVKAIKAPIKKGTGAMCYRCGERGHIQFNCPQKDIRTNELEQLKQRMETVEKKCETSISSKAQGNE